MDPELIEKWTGNEQQNGGSVDWEFTKRDVWI